MEIQHSAINPATLHEQIDRQTPDEIGAEFEQIFARQLVQEMTKGLFKNDDKQGVMGNAGSDLYRRHIVDTLSKELAEHQDLGIEKNVIQYLSRHNK